MRFDVNTAANVWSNTVDLYIYQTIRRHTW